MFGIDCHTMASTAPPLASNRGTERPLISIADNEGNTLPFPWRERLKSCFEEAYDLPVAINEPFKGGYIITQHSSDMPWVQLKLSRAPFYSLEEKRERLIKALACFSIATK